MLNRVRIHRDRPTVLSWAIALTVTMLIVYLATLSAPYIETVEDADVFAPHITQEIVLEGIEIYFVDFALYENAADARIAAARYALRGGAGYVYADADGYHVLGAGYDQQTDAERISKRLHTQESIESTVLHCVAESVSLRITAPQSSIDAIVSANAVLRNELRQIAAMALQIDRDELSATSVRTLCALSKSAMDAAHRGLADISGAEEHPVCNGLSALLERLSIALGQISRSQESSSALSGLLRCCHVDGMVGLIQYLNALQ